MATLKLVLRESKKRADGTAPVYLRITQDRKTRYISTGIAVAPSKWNEAKEEVRKSHPQSVVFNDELKRQKAEAQKEALDLKRNGGRKASALAIKKAVKGQGIADFFPFAEKYAAEWEAKGKYWEWRKVNVLIKKLADFHGSRDLDFSEIDHNFLIRFERYMRGKLKNKTNTISKNLQILHRIMKRAIQERLTPVGENPFLYYTIKSAPTTKEKLSLAEIHALEKLDLSNDPALALTRDAFLFSFYCAGVRFGDLCRLKWKNAVGGRLTYMMAKTGTPKSVKIPGPAEQILARYRSKADGPDSLIFPILDTGLDYSDPVFVRKRISSKNVVVNRNLKTLAERIETKVNLSFHVSRHSFADYARTSGKDLYAISKALGHSKLQTTQVYLKSFDEEAVDDMMDGLFD